MSGPLDCVLVGYNDTDFSSLVTQLKPHQANNGGYSYLKSNSVLLDGQRLTYTALLNRVLSESNSRPSSLNVFELPNLGCCYLAAFLRRRELSVEIVNFYNRDRDLLAALLSDGPRTVAITTTFYVDPSPIAEIVRFIREHNSETKIIVGGPHIFNTCKDYDATTQEHMFKTMGADIYVPDPQGELTLSRILKALRNGESLDDVPNLIYRRPGGGAPVLARPPGHLPLIKPGSPPESLYARTKIEPETNDMNSESMDWSLIEPSMFTPATQTRTARSYAFKCSFCTFPAMAGELALTDLDVIERELRFLQRAGVKYLTFIDDTFNVPLPRFKNLCRMMIKNDFGIQWISHFRAGNADDETFDLMQKAGCVAVFLGIESGDQSVLNNMNKAAKIERYAYGIEQLHKHGIVSFASFIVGFPGETTQSVDNTIEFIEKTAPTFMQAALYYHYHGTPIHQKRAEHGIRGSGYAWTHNTMNWREGADSVFRIYSTVKNSTILPIFGFDFFGIPYFLSKGISFDQLSGFLKLAHPMLIESYKDQPVDFSGYERKLRELLRTEPAAQPQRTWTTRGGQSLAPP